MNYLDAVDVDVRLPLTRTNVANVLHVHQHSAQQLVQLGRISAVQVAGGGASTNDVMAGGGRFYDAGHFPLVAQSHRTGRGRREGRVYRR